MPIVKIFSSETAGNTPPTTLLAGQLAINSKDRKILYRDPDLGANASLLDQLAALSTSQNMFSNPGMEVDLEHVGAAVTAIAASKYVIDGGFFQLVGSPTARFTSQQVSDAPPGYVNSIKISVTTAQASFTTTQAVELSFKIEGSGPFSRLAWGTASAKSLVIGFWAKANRTGQYGGSIAASSGVTRVYPFSITISSSGVWQYFTVVIPGDTTSGWTFTNSASVQLNIVMAAGSTAQGTANVWSSSSSVVTATGQINGCAATTDFLQIGGITAHQGNIVVPQDRAPFLMPSYADCLWINERYYEKSYAEATAPGTITNNNAEYAYVDNTAGTSTSSLGTVTRFRRRKRTTATFTCYSPVTGASGKARDVANSADVTYSTAGATTTDELTASMFLTANAVAAGFAFAWHWTSDARL